MLKPRYTTYLVSPIASVVKEPDYTRLEVYTFRDFVKDKLSNFNINIIDPVEHQKTILTDINKTSTILEGLYNEAITLAEEGRPYDDLLKTISKKLNPIVKEDLRCVRTSHFLIGYAHGDFPSIGMVDEISQAVFCRIPVYLMVEKYNKISSWLTVMVYETKGRIFLGKHKKEECIDFIIDKYFKNKNLKGEKL